MGIHGHGGAPHGGHVGGGGGPNAFEGFVGTGNLHASVHKAAEQTTAKGISTQDQIESAKEKRDNTGDGNVRDESGQHYEDIATTDPKNPKIPKSNPNLPSMPPRGAGGTGNPFFNVNPMVTFFGAFLNLINELKFLELVSNKLDVLDMKVLVENAKDQGAAIMKQAEAQANALYKQAAMSFVEAGASAFGAVAGFKGSIDSAAEGAASKANSQADADLAKSHLDEETSVANKKYHVNDLSEKLDGENEELGSLNKQLKSPKEDEGVDPTKQKDLKAQQMEIKEEDTQNLSMAENDARYANSKATRDEAFANKKEQINTKIKANNEKMDKLDEDDKECDEELKDESKTDEQKEHITKKKAQIAKQKEDIKKENASLEKTKDKLDNQQKRVDTILKDDKEVQKTDKKIAENNKEIDEKQSEIDEQSDKELAAKQRAEAAEERYKTSKSPADKMNAQANRKEELAARQEKERLNSEVNNLKKENKELTNQRQQRIMQQEKKSLETSITKNKAELEKKQQEVKEDPAVKNARQHYERKQQEANHAELNAQMGMGNYQNKPWFMAIQGLTQTINQAASGMSQIFDAEGKLEAAKWQVDQTMLQGYQQIIQMGMNNVNQNVQDAYQQAGDVAKSLGQIADQQSQSMHWAF